MVIIDAIRSPATCELTAGAMLGLSCGAMLRAGPGGARQRQSQACRRHRPHRSHPGQIDELARSRRTPRRPEGDQGVDLSSLRTGVSSLAA
jgi:hypothetical protein